MALCAGCAESQEPVKLTPKQTFERSVRGNWSYPCESKFREGELDDAESEITAPQFSYERVLIFTNSNKLVIRERFFKDDSCSVEYLACSFTVIYAYQIGKRVEENSIEESTDKTTSKPAYEINLTSTENGDFDSQIDPQFCEQIAPSIRRSDRLFTIVRLTDDNSKLNMGKSTPDRNGKSVDQRHESFNSRQTATRF